MNLHRPQHTEDLDPHVEQLLARIRAIIAEYDNQQRTDIVMRAKRFHAARGRAISRPPTGYIAYTKGQWKKDPAVSAQIAEVFRLYETLGSAGKVVRFLTDQGIQMPLRTPAGTLRWVRPTHSRIYHILTNPAFMGWYVFGRCARMNDARYGKRRTTAWEECIVVRNHHEPYVTPETWHQINQLLRRRAGRVHQQIPVEPPHSEKDKGNDQAAPPSGEGMMEETNE